MSNSTITVEFKTERTYCSCCRQKLEKVEVSKVRTMEFDKETALSWAPWPEIVEYPEDMERSVPEYVHETIDFFATSSYERIIVENSEIEKVKQWIINDVASNPAE
ncbi:hypothetical protein [Paenibacillus sp. Marseille-Q4541]|uniref:hypothetical protein n=1 Tax=Paenibacillus sp. Marseille-Q4541 TaxID=2831522 RepID=UPI001BAA07EC|nr:hypothetical protein [Paenibacillus sp. Marseille-Q4541]